MSQLTKCLFVGVFIIALSSCASFEANPTKKHDNLCNQLKNRILMTGTSYSDRIADQQRAELGKLNANYRAQGCE